LKTRNDERRRRELCDFLKYARSRIAPREAGIKDVGRRRVPGLRRDEVAALCGVSVDWYTWFETGRPSVGFSPRFIATVARSLQLRTDETIYLFSLAIPEMPSVPSPARPQVDSALESIVLEWDHPKAEDVPERFERCDALPLGIYCTTPGGDILYANRSLTSLLGYNSMSSYRKLNVTADLYHSPSERTCWQNTIALIGTLQKVPTKARRADGRQILLLDSATAIRAKDDEVTHYVGVWEPA
jgi:transcriptional regulator with XRE-family HTH domain